MLAGAGVAVFAQRYRFPLGKLQAQEGFAGFGDRRVIFMPDELPGLAGVFVGEYRHQARLEQLVFVAGAPDPVAVVAVARGVVELFFDDGEVALFDVLAGFGRRPGELQAVSAVSFGWRIGTVDEVAGHALVCQ